MSVEETVEFEFSEPKACKNGALNVDRIAQ
jgi:hypothetical protein